MVFRLFVKWLFICFEWYDCIDTTVPSEVPLCWEYCFLQTNNHKRFKILKFIYIFSDTIFTCCQFSRRCIPPHFWILSAFIWGQCSLVFVTFSWFFHKFNKRCMFTCYKSSCSGNLLTQSCLLIPVSHLDVRYSQHV